MYPSSNVDNQPIIYSQQHHYQANTSTSNTMKLLSPTTALFLTYLFTTTFATGNLSISFEALPSIVHAGGSYDVKWTANQDFVSPNPFREKKKPPRKKG
jgi:hypothetical protein